jgi:hypothetical protein
MTCKECSKEVKGSGVIYCSTTCKEAYAKKAANEKFAQRAESMQGVENVDYVVCKWCNSRVKRIYGIHIKNHHPGKTTFDYRKEFPEYPLTCKTDKQSTSKSSGLHMKDVKYRKIFSDKVKGENNPNHKSKTTVAVRKSRSPFSQDFVSYGNVKDKKEAVSAFVKTALCNRLTQTQLEYWVRECGDEDLAKIMHAERQRTFTIEKCVQKYGEADGLRIWEERQTKWQKKILQNFINEGDGRSPQSQWAKRIIKECCDSLNIDMPKKEKYISSKNNEKRYAYDFSYSKKIIEFNGDFWHAHPNIFNAEDVIPVLNVTALEKWNYDKEKIKLAEFYGYEVLVVWESEYRKDPDTVVQKCIDFLNEQNNIKTHSTAD